MGDQLETGLHRMNVYDKRVSQWSALCFEYLETSVRIGRVGPQPIDSLCWK